MPRTCGARLLTRQCGSLTLAAGETVEDRSHGSVIRLVGKGAAGANCRPVSSVRLPHPTFQFALDSERKRLMAFKTNYRFQRTERDRAKAAKKEEKLKKRQVRGAASSAADAPTHPDEDTRPDE